MQTVCICDSLPLDASLSSLNSLLDRETQTISYWLEICFNLILLLFQMLFLVIQFIVLVLCVCVWIHMCAHVWAGARVCGARGQRQVFSSVALHFIIWDREILFEPGAHHLAGLAGQPTSEIHPPASTRKHWSHGCICHAQIFTMVLEVWSQNLMLAEQVLYPLSHLPHPIITFPFVFICPWLFGQCCGSKRRPCTH